MLRYVTSRHVTSRHVTSRHVTLNLDTDQETWSVRFPHDKKMISIYGTDVKFLLSKFEGFLESGFLDVCQLYVC